MKEPKMDDKRARYEGVFHREVEGITCVAWRVSRDGTTTVQVLFPGKYSQCRPVSEHLGF